MAIGPVEYMIVAFPGNKFKGEIAPALAELIDSQTIRLIDLAFVIKDEDGNVATLEVGDLDSEVGAAFAELAGQGPGGLLNQEDLEAARGDGELRDLVLKSGLRVERYFRSGENYAAVAERHG